ncbi:tunicamycin resistance protein [Aspergillus melleus]|uniref:Tunicamycin resistance protein n=1 Tax=Aspergillus melleus TaxID=138277 RepID=A0ACC3ARX4_9EURO|nr:tunicamycin resistance protein [Aspergillus melleus]
MSSATSSSLSSRETWRLLILVGVCLGIIFNSFQGEGAPLVASIAFSGIGFAITFSLIRWLGPVFVKAGLKGRDMAKPRRPEIPETMGAVCAIVYLLGLIFFIPFAFYKDIVAATSGGGNRDVVLEVDHVENGRMLHRFPHGKPYLGSFVDLGWLYYAYMAAVSIFCPNSINMLAGINGVEVAQSLVIAVLLIANDLLYLAPITPFPHPATDSHLFSLYLLLPFVGVSLALLFHNWYPSKVFVGDTYCYFAGMVFAVVSILGHFSKTLLLLFIPQIFNFLYSTPQLFKLIPCPRHRLPRFNGISGLLDASVTEWTVPPSPLVATALDLLHGLRLVRVTRNEKGQIVESTNLTILNLWLVWWGPMREDRLALSMVIVQFVCGLFGLFVRHCLALLVFREDNRAFRYAV